MENYTIIIFNAKEILKERRRSCSSRKRSHNQGALESGVQFVSTYPGTPASEIGNVFHQMSQSGEIPKSIYFEFSVNEK